MRYAKGHKAASHERILKTAARNFRRDGIAAAGVARIMSESGLTNGGFYAHFRSKSELVREGLARILDEQLRCLVEADAAPAELSRLIHSYLSSECRDRPEIGCPSAALLPEISRQPRAVRKIYTVRIREILTQVRRRLPRKRTVAASQNAAIGIYAVLVGALQLARAVDDRALSDDILAAGVRAATALADLPGGEQ
jgi:TetR/AcrR family transcriptional regulator, transcriptional repressor for nem operon